jgi:eukaryotic-like serine/threonine-protein kinase
MEQTEPEEVRIALTRLSTVLAGRPELESAMRARWSSGAMYPTAPVAGELRVELREDQRAAANVLGRALPPMTHVDSGIAALGELFGEPEGEVLFAWCGASVWRRDARLARLLEIAAAHPAFRERVARVARDRVVEGPLHDALACAPLLGDGAALASPDNVQARARLEILFWEAGASAVEVPHLAKWLWGSASTFEAMIRGPARGTLRGRVLAARCLEVTVRGMSPEADPELVGRTLQVLQPLLLHPEPLVWVHAARALGRLTGPLPQLEGTLLDWVLGESRVLRQRSMTAVASVPAERMTILAGQLAAIIASPDEEAWVLAAVAAATPYLFFERRDLWDRLARRILAGDGGAITARALARGLMTIRRRGALRSQVEREGASILGAAQAIPDEEIEEPLCALRDMARRARATSLDDARRWIEVTAWTDAVDGAERDPLDLELGIENLMRVAAQYDDEEADARAARFAGALAPTFAEARRIALGSGSLRQRAAAMNALEGCARAFGLRLWGPLLATRPSGLPLEEPELEETWKAIAHAPAEILDLVEGRRTLEGVDRSADLPLEVLALRLGGYALDACGEDGTLGPGRGPTAHDTCLWLRKLSGLADGSRDLPAPLEGALSALFWRLVDTTRGTALGEVDDVRWLGPFAAWWALVIDRPAMLLKLATALPMMAEGALAKCCEQAEALRAAISSDAPDGQWGPSASEALEALHAGDTELAFALSGLARALATFPAAAGNRPNLEAMCLELVLAGERLHEALANPVKALHAGGEEIELSDEDDADSLARRATENAPRVAALVSRAIRARELSLLDVWFASLGPTASALVEGAVRAAIRRTPPPPPQAKRAAPTLIAGYELVKPIGEGGIGKVWLVRKPGADRLFVLKTPKADALANANDREREGILTSFVEEANALAGLYHPNVASIIDRGVAENVPFLVLEYLIGADLKEYAGARLMSLFELRQVVLDSCAGLAALHNAGLVHRDIKPANIWLRLPLAGGVRFEPEKHRDPAMAQPLAAVVIDFGMVRAIRVPPEVGGRFVAGTAGYIAPEQVLDPVELDVRADVYALAGTIYNVTTGRSFFDEVPNPRDRIVAHMRRDPFAEGDRLQAYPVAVAKILRAATATNPRDRPSPIEFGKAFAAAI